MYGNAKIKYQQTTITAAYIEIDWSTNTIFATTANDSLGNKIGHPVLQKEMKVLKPMKLPIILKVKSVE